METAVAPDREAKVRAPERDSTTAEEEEEEEGGGGGAGGGAPALR